MSHFACLRLPGLLALLLMLAACAPALDVKPIDLNAEPAAQIKSLKTSLDAARREEVHLFSPAWFARADASAAQAATIILDGVKADTLRILVGRDAHLIDGMVRQDPDHAYDAEFYDRFAAAAGWYPGR